MWGMPVFLFLYPLLLSVVDGEGSKNIWPTSAPACGALDAGSCRANLEWRNDSYGFGVGQMYRRTLFYVFLNAGEYLLMGSTAQGLNASNIEVFLPGTVTGKPGNETLPPTAALSCSTQLPTNGVITTRTQELAGPQAPVGGGNPTGYPPCVYLALVTGIHNVAMYGPLGRLPDPANGLVGADIALTNALNFNDSQKTTMAGWDLTVRADLTTTTNIEGRAFTYALSMITANNSMPVFLSFYAIVPDGYVYRVDTRGMDPNGWVMYGNKVGFYDSDMQTPLYHDIRGRNGQLTLVTGDVGIAPPEFPLFFNPPNSATLTALNYPLTPIPPVLGSIKFHGSVTANAGGLGVGGTFEVTSSGNATYAIVISRDGIDFDPTNPLNRVLRGFVSGTVANVTWGGKDNFGNAFPVGGPYYVSGTVHGGEYHFPMLDVESSALGGPTITLTNAACPPLNGGCHAAFYDDRGYQPMTGVPVGNATNLCPGFDYGPTILFSHPTLGFDSSSSQRAFGVKTFASNFNTDCRAGSPVFGDAKGLDLWTYTPSANKSTPLWVVQRAITGHVWLDVNNDGIESGAGETPFANVNVTVSNGTTSITVKTDEFGNYYADVGASAQNWIVTVAIPPGYYLTTFNNPQTVSTAVGTLFNATKVGLSASSFAPTNAPTAVPTTQSPVTLSPVTASPTSLAPTTNSPTFSPTKNPTTVSPTTKNPTTLAPTTESPTTLAPTTNHPTTQSPTTKVPTTENPTTVGPTTGSPTHNPTTKNPTTQFPTTQNPVTANPTTNPTTVNPTTNNPTTSTPTQNPTTQNPTTKVPTTGNPTKSPTTQIPTTSPTTVSPTTSSPTPCATNVTGFTGIFASSAWQVQKEPGSTATTTFTATTLTMVTNNGGQPDPTRSNASIVVSTITDIYFTWSYSTPDRATKDEPRYAVNGIELGVFPGFIEHDTNQSQQGSFHVELLPGDRLTISAYSYDNIRTPATFVIGNFTAINRVCSNAPTTGVPTVSPTSSSPTPCDLVVTGFTGFFAPSQWTREIEVGSSASTVYFTNEGLQVMTNNIPGTVPTAETRYNYSIFNNKPMTISFSWNYTSFDRASKDEPKHFADGVEYLDTGFLNSDDTVGFQSGAVAGVNVGANQAFKFIAYSFDNIRGPATITIFNFHAVVHSCSVAPTTRTPTTQTPTTLAPGTKVPTTLMPTPGPTPPTTLQPVTKFPTKKPTTRQPTTRVPTTHAPTAKPTVPAPVTELPTPAPSVMILPTTQPTPKQPTVSPTACARTVSGFQGLFDPSLWTLTNDPNSNGFVSFFTVDQLQMWSNDAGPSQRKRLIEGITVPMTTIVTFQWEYSTPDRPTFDVPVYSINGAETRFPGFDASTIGPTHQSGVVGPLTLQAGQTFKIIFDSIDGIFGSARLDIFGWQAYINTCISPTAPSTMTLPPSSPTQAAPTSAVSPTTPPTSPTIPPTSPTAKAPTACDRTVGGFQSLFAPELWTMTNDAGSNAYVGMFTVNQLQMWSDNAGPSNSKRLAEGITITAPSTVSFQWTYQTPDRPTFDIPFYSINGVDTMFPGFNTSWTGAQAQSGVVGPLTLQPGQTFKIIFDSLDGIFGAAELNIFGWQARINTCGTPTTPTAPTAPTSPTSPTQKSPTMPPTATSPTACDRTVGGFQGLFAPPLWTMTNDAGSSAYVALFTVNQLQMWSDNAGPSDSRRLAEGITITAPSIVSFQWTYQTPDRPTFDIPYYSINGIDTMFTGFNTSWTGPQSQSGVVGPLTLQPGQYFKIIFDSLDGIFGAAELDIFGWQARINTCGTPTTPTAPTATSPTAASPTASGPTASAPTASGPTASGPTAQQPSVVAPTSKPTSSPTVFVFRVVTIPPTTAVVSQVYLYPFGTSLGPNQEVVAVTGLPSWLSLQPDNVIAGVPPSSAVGGSYPIVISASDGNGNTIMQNFTLTVINPQIPPQITSVPPLTATPGTPYIYPISTTGSPSPSVMVITDAPWLVFNPYTNTLEGIPPAGSGPVTVSIAVSNGNSPNAYQSFVVQVGAAPTNAPSSKPSVAGTTLTPTSAPTLATSPTITSTPPSNALVNQQFCYQIVATGSPQPTLSVNSLPTWMTFRDGEICGIPPVGTSGNVIITVVASNGNPPDATQLVVIHVGTQAPTQGVTAAPTAAPTIGSSCPPPHITSFPPLTTTSTANPYVYTITADSPVSLSLDSSVITPGWLQIVGNQLKGTPPPGTSGNALAKIRATNACGAYDVQLVSIAITNPAPQLQSLSCNTVEGSAFLIPISATGTPQPQLALFGAPSWMNLVNNSIRGTPPAGSAGTQYTIQVLATNGYAPNALVSCSGWVQGPTDFTVTGNPPTTVLVGSTYTYAPVITTSSSGDPTLLLQVAPPWLNVQGTQLVGVPPQGGSYPVVLLICDSTGRQCVEKSFTITAQQPVTLGGPFNQTVGVGAQYKFTVPVSGGYPAPVLQLSNAPSWLTINGTTVSGTPPSGTTAFTYTVIGANGVNPTAFATYNVTVGGGMSCSQGLDELTQEAAKLANYSTDDQLPLCALASTGLVTLAASNNLTSCQKACFQPQATVTTITLGGGSGRRLLTLANITAAEDEIARQWGLSLSPRKVYIVGQDPLRVVTLVPPGSVTGPLAFVNGQAVVSANQTSASQKDLLDLLASLQKGTRAGTGSSTTSATVETTPAYAYVLAGLLFVTVLLCLYFMVHFFGQRRKKEASDRG